MSIDKNTTKQNSIDSLLAMANDVERQNAFNKKMLTITETDESAEVAPVAKDKSDVQKLSKLVKKQEKPKQEDLIKTVLEKHNIHHSKKSEVSETAEVSESASKTEESLAITEVIASISEDEQFIPEEWEFTITRNSDKLISKINAKKINVINGSIYNYSESKH